MQRMSRYLFISLLLFSCSGLWSQEITKNFLRGTISRPQGISVGVNLAGPINKIIDGDRTGFSLISRFNLTDIILFKAEAGYENVSFEKDSYHYNSNGSFIKLGLERDILPKKEEGSRDNILVGLHYGFALQEQGSDYCLIENGYWNDYSGRIGSNTLKSHWLELSVGPRAEVFKNFYMNWNLHLRLSIADSNTSLLEPYIVPGFGAGDKNFVLGFSYTIEYLIPWKK